MTPTHLGTTPRPTCLARAAACLMLASLLGGQALAQTTTAPAVLEDLETLLQRPVYAASKFALDAARAPAAVTVFTAGDIKAYGWRTLVEVLNGMRGLSTRDDRTYTTVGVRGFDPLGEVATRVLVTIDGMRVNENIYDEAVGGREFPLPVDLIERVEVITGPGAALYGPNALFAVVNVYTKSAAQLGGGNATLGLGSHGARLLSLRKGISIGEGSLVIAARSESRPGSDWCFAEYVAEAPPDGCARGRDGETDRKLFARWSSGQLNLAFVASRRTKFRPTAIYGSDFGASAPSTDTYALGDVHWQAEPAPGHQVYTRATLGNYGYEARLAFGGEVWRERAHGRWLAGEARWLYERTPGHRLILGLEAQRNLRQHMSNGYVSGTDFTETDSRSERYALFVNDDWAISPRWRLSAGLRLDRLQRGDLRTTPRLGLVFTPVPNMHWKLLSGRAFREASAFEARYEEAGVSVGNANLSVERLNANELALDWRPWPNLRIAASRYDYRISDVIGQSVDPVSGLIQNRNGSGARARGHEIEIDRVADNDWRMRLSWSTQATFDPTTNARLPNSPRSLTKLHVTGPVPGWVGWRVGVEGQRVGQRNTRDGSALPAHAVANVTLQWARPSSQWSLDLSLYNALDKHYADPAANEQRALAIAREGRQFEVRATLAF
jgi:outer membrane receptor protein involved in Fe transport